MRVPRDPHQSPAPRRALLVVGDMVSEEMPDNWATRQTAVAHYVGRVAVASVCKSWVWEERPSLDWTTGVDLGRTWKAKKRRCYLTSIRLGAGILHLHVRQSPGRENFHRRRIKPWE